MKKLVAVMLVVLVGTASARAVAEASGNASEEADLGAAMMQEAPWAVWGGELRVRLNRNLFDNFGIEVSTAHQPVGTLRNMDRFAVGDSVGLQLNVKQGVFLGFIDGALRVSGGYDLRLPDGSALTLRDFSLRPNANDPYVLDVITPDGHRWFYANKLMFVLEHHTPTFVLRSMDLRMAPELADRLGNPTLADRAFAEMQSDTPVWRGAFAKGGGGSCPTSTRWPGMAAPGGNTYQADVFMHHFTVQTERQNATADGPGGNDTGRVKFTPSSTLINNVNNGTAVETVVGDPRGTSSALYAADVVWRQKFFSNCPPYGNDQHPYLIWNMYRIDPDGSIAQIGRSGIKHAFLTTNQFCSDPGVSSGYVLRRGCQDTYGVGNNDNSNDLGPRSEVIAASGLWGRCGSIHDLNCDGNDSDFAGFNDFTHRMMVTEGQFDPTRNPGASYLFESWYIVRDDIDIYNTMQTRTSTFSWNGGWNVSHPAASTDMLLGPAIDRWVNPTGGLPNQRNTEIVDPGGRSKVAVKVSDLGDGRFRYDYAVMNFDFARPQTEGTSPNLRVLSNDGFISFSVPASAALQITDVNFSDGDTDPGNDWTRVEEPNRVTWSAPVGNRLNWGSLFSFSFTANAAPVEAPARLTTAQPVPTETLDADTLVPQSTAVVTYAVGGDLDGLGAGQSVTLRLNSGSPLTLSADGGFVFPNEVIEGGSYTATVVTQPASQTCEIANASGTISGADVDNIAVTCTDNPPPTYSIGGMVTGLGGERTISLHLNGEDTLTPVANGQFTFHLQLLQGANYTVTLSDVPADRICNITRGTGVVGSANVTNVAVACTAATGFAIGGSISGLSGTVGLQLNGDEILQRSANGSFTFVSRLNAGDAYAVTVATQPAGQRCEVASGEGLVGSSSVADVAVTCEALSTHTVGGQLTGLPAGRSIALRLNGGPALVLSSSRTFTFSQPLFDGDPYEVTIASSPSGLECSVLNGTGVVEGGNIGDVRVSCREPGQSVPFADGFE